MLNVNDGHNSIINSQFVVPEISCSGCAESIKRALKPLDSVSEVNVEISEKRVTVAHSPEIGRADIARVLENAGFSVEESKA